MRIAKLALLFLLIGATPVDAPIGHFQTWLASGQTPVIFISAGVTVRVDALPCPLKPVRDSTCRWDGYNNQAIVTVSAPGMAALSIPTDPQSAYVRVAVVRFGRGDPRPGVIIQSQSGGSGGDMTAQLVIPAGRGYRVVSMVQPGGLRLQGELADAPRDLSGDGHIDLKLEDGAFDSVFGCNACTPRPPRLFAVNDGRVVDESRDPALHSIFAADMARLVPICRSTAQYRNGACAAYVADAARAGRFDEAWAVMLRHHERDGDRWGPCDVAPSAWTDHRCPDGHITRFADFPASLRAYLKRTGYLPAS